MTMSCQSFDDDDPVTYNEAMSSVDSEKWHSAMKSRMESMYTKRNAAGQPGLSPLQKITAAFRMLAYGVPADATDEYIKIGESTALESLKKLCRAIVEIFGQQYLRSPNANDVARFFTSGIAPSARYVIQEKEYDMGYYLAGGIYPKWSTLVQTIRDPRGPKKKLFAMKQEACQKDVERAFGVLKSRFAIIAGPSRFWSKNVLHDIMTACITMHNMIIEDERDLSAPIEESELPDPEVETISIDENTRFQEFLNRHRKIKNKETHIALRDVLIAHLWEEYTNSEN
ncbi:hypothetical protein AgCh_012851 [Apium graveolens]